MPTAPPGVLVVEEVAGQIDQGVVAALGRGADRVTVEVGGFGDPQSGADHRVALGGQGAVEGAGAVQGAGQVHGPVGVVRFDAVGGGVGLPHGHGPHRVGDGQPDQRGHQFGFVAGEHLDQRTGGGGHHRVDLAAGQDPGPPGGGGDRQRPQPAGHVEVWWALRLVSPARSRSQAVIDVAPSPSQRPVESKAGDGVGELGVEPVPQGENLGQGVTVDGDLQPVDRLLPAPRTSDNRTPVRLDLARRKPLYFNGFVTSSRPSEGSQGRPQAARRGSLDGPVSVRRHNGNRKPVRASCSPMIAPSLERSTGMPQAHA